MRLLSLLLAACTDPDPGVAPGEVRSFERTWVDPSRPTPELADLPASDDRTLRTRIWLRDPDDGGRPLLLIAHGNEGLPEKFDAFATHLAAQGVVVAAPAFPASHLGSGAGPILGPTDLAMQPGDLSFVLDALRDEVTDPDAELFETFHPGRVVALGHSLGGATVLGWTRFDEPETSLVATAFLSPAVPLTTVFGTMVSPEGPPTLVMNGQLDLLIPPVVSQQLEAGIEDPAWYLGIAGAGHSDALEDPDDGPPEAQQACEAAVLALIRQYALGWPGALPNMLDALEAAGHEVRR